jgi:hypothetical protein
MAHPQQADAAVSEQVRLFAVTDLLKAAFEEFHEANPSVYAEIVRLARLAVIHGQSRWSINALFELVRWNRMIDTARLDWKMDNNHRAYYAREIMRREPDLAGFFEVRKTRAERDDDSEEC